MHAFLSISLWITLATIIPGMITMSTIYGAVEIIGTTDLIVDDKAMDNNFVWLAISAAIMVMTQSFGILLEKLLVSTRIYGRKPYVLELPEGFAKCNKGLCKVDSEFEYKYLYLLLVRLAEHEDSQGHLKRCLGQFFLSNNSMISFIAGIIASICLMFINDRFDQPSIIYLSGLCVFLITTFYVARLRFNIMIETLWATRNLREVEKSAE